MTYFKDHELVIRNMEEGDGPVFTEEYTAQGWHPDIAVYQKRLRDQAEGKCIALTAVYQGRPAGSVYLYLTVKEGPFRGKGWPMIVDFNVLKKYQRKGIGSKLMDTAEQIALQHADTVCLGVGLCREYGTAQRMYVKRGYVPDGSGVWYQDRQCVQYETVCTVDDDLVLYMSKKLPCSRSRNEEQKLQKGPKRASAADTGTIETLTGGQAPASIAAVLGSQTGKTDGLGKSEAQVLLFDDYVLKIRPADSWDTTDVQILQWFAGKAPVPQVAAHEVLNGQDWLLMTRIQGTELCKPEVMNNATLLLDCMAEALHTLWSIPIAECPFERTVADNLSHAEAAILAGRFDPSDCEPETFGPGGFENPKALLNWLKSHLPQQDRVVTHGDFCLPNLFTDGKRLTGFIDVGNAGAGDRWMDLALGWRSLKHNSDGHYGKIYPNIHPDDLFRAAGVPKDEEKLRYYILLDELN